MKKLFFFLIFLSFLLYAQSMNLENYRGFFYVQPDGSVLVKEELQVFLNGTFEQGQGGIPLKPGQYVSNLIVYSAANEVNHSQDVSDSMVFVTWPINDSNSRKVFKFQYVLHNALESYSDFLKFEQKFFSSPEIPPSSYSSITMFLPGNSTEKPQAFFKTSPQNCARTLANTDVGRADFMAQNFRRNCEIQAAILFSRSNTNPDAKMQVSSEKILEKTQNEYEKPLFFLPNNQVVPIALVILFSSILALVYLLIPNKKQEKSKLNRKARVG